MTETVTFQDVRDMFQEMIREDRERRVELDRRFKETEEQVKETSRSLEETKRIVKEVSLQIGNLGSRWGEFLEGVVAPACETLFAQRGIPVHKVSRRVKVKQPGGRHMEIDLLVVDTDAVVLVEVKSRLTAEKIREHIIRLAEFKEFFPEYADKRVFGAVAGIVIDENVDRFAMNEGMFVMVQSGETVQLANELDFVPREY